MRKYILALCLLALTACSSDSGGGKGGLDPAKDFDLKAKPANPAPTSYINGALLTLRDSEQYIPGDAAIFNSIIVNGDVRYVYNGSAERTEAMNKLHPVGVNFVSDIQRNCDLNPARKVETGTPGKGATVTQNLTLSSAGANCGLLINKSINNTTVYNQLDLDRVANKATIGLTINSVNKESRELKDANIINYSNVVSSNVENTMTGTMKAVIDQFSKTSDFQGTGTGTMKMKFANGDVVEGPTATVISMKSSETRDGKTEATEIKYRFDGKSPKGDVKIVLVLTNEGVKAAINGEEVDPSSLGGIQVNITGNM